LEYWAGHCWHAWQPGLSKITLQAKSVPVKMRRMHRSCEVGIAIMEGGCVTAANLPVGCASMPQYVCEATSGNEGLALASARLLTWCSLSWSCRSKRFGGVRRLKASPKPASQSFCFRPSYQQRRAAPRHWLREQTPCWRCRFKPASCSRRSMSVARPGHRGGLRQSEERFRFGNGAWMCGLGMGCNRRRGDASAGIAPVPGLSARGSGDSRWWLEQIHPADLARVERHFAETLAARVPLAGH